MSAVLAMAGVLAQLKPYQQPAQWSYVLAAWGLLFVVFAVYVAILLRRGRKLAQQVPPEERRWIG